MLTLITEKIGKCYLLDISIIKVWKFSIVFKIYFSEVSHKKKILKYIIQKFLHVTGKFMTRPPNKLPSSTFAFDRLHNTSVVTPITTDSRWQTSETAGWMTFKSDRSPDRENLCTSCIIMYFNIAEGRHRSAVVTR